MAEVVSRLADYIYFLLVYMTVFLVPVALGPERWVRLVNFFRYWPRLSRIRGKLPRIGPIFGERFGDDVSIVLPGSPKFVYLPKFKGLWIGARIALWLIWYLIVILPAWLVGQLLWLPVFILLFMNYMAMRSRKGHPELLRPWLLFKDARTGLGASNAGRKGGTSKARTTFIVERDEEIREEAARLLASGTSQRELARILTDKFSIDDGYPKHPRTYRDIIKPIFDEKK